MNRVQRVVAGIRDVLQSAHWVPDDEAAEWAKTTTLLEMGWMTVRWLNGELAATPGYTARVDVDEHIAPGITDALIALNLAGFLTDNSQGAYDGPDYAASPWEAWVCGFADDTTLEWLMDAVEGTPFRIWAWPPADGRSQWRRTRALGDRPNNDGSRPASASDLRWMYSVCSEQAIDAVCAAWQVTIYDPEPGRNEIWEYLRQAAENRLDR